jgi:MFS family permease
VKGTPHAQARTPRSDGAGRSPLGRWLRRTGYGLPRTFWYLWVANLINRSGGFVNVLLTFYLSRERGLEAGLIGVVIGLIGGGSAVWVLVGGHLADRWGRRACLLLALLVNALCLSLLAVTYIKWLVPLIGLLLGAAQGMARPAYATMMIDLVPEADRHRAFNLNYWSNNLAFSIAAPVGGLLTDFNYLLIFIGDVATTLLMVAAVFLLVPETKPQTPRVAPTDAATASAAIASAATANPLRDPAFLGLCALAFLVGLAFMQYMSSLPLAMVRDGLAAKSYGAIIAINSLMIVMGQLLVPRLVRGWDRSKTLALASLTVGIGFGLTAFAHQPALYAVTVVIWTLGEMLQFPASPTLTADLSPVASRGRYQGIYSLFISAAAFLGPLAGGLVLERLGATPLWIGCFCVCVVAATLHLVARPSRNRRIENLRRSELATVDAEGTNAGSR